MCHLVVLDDGIPYKIVFIAMYETLNLDHDVLTKRKHKDLTVERFHRFLNKISFIAAKESAVLMIFPAGVVAGCAWNSVLIDSTDMFLSISTISWKLYFSLDTSINALPKLTQDNG